MNKPFKPGDNVRTRNGREARIFMVDGGGERPIIGAIQEKSGRWWAHQWCADGLCCDERPECTTITDLIHVPETRTVAVKIYLMPDGRINAHPAALEPHISGAFGSQTVELTFEEGRHG